METGAGSGTGEHRHTGDTDMDIRQEWMSFTDEEHTAIWDWADRGEWASHKAAARARGLDKQTVLARARDAAMRWQKRSGYTGVAGKLIYTFYRREMLRRCGLR
jgi:hypothetical protein